MKHNLGHYIAMVKRDLIFCSGNELIFDYDSYIFYNVAQGFFKQAQEYRLLRSILLFIIEESNYHKIYRWKNIVKNLRRLHAQ